MPVYSMAEVERLLAEVGIDRPDRQPGSQSMDGEAVGRKLRLWTGGLSGIIDQLGLPADLAAWTEAERMAFKLAL